MTRIARRAAVALLAASSSGCLGSAPARQRPADGAGNAIVIQGEQLQGRGSNLLGIIRQNTSSLQVRSGPNCPQIIMRGQKSVLGISAPSVYVDNQRAADTCILELLNVHDVQRVEVYPMGISSRPGILANGAGLILVFTRRAR